MDDCSFRIEWPDEDGGTRVYSGYRVTAEAARLARVEKIRWLSEKFPKGRRTVLIRGA